MQGRTQAGLHDPEAKRYDDHKHSERIEAKWIESDNGNAFSSHLARVRLAQDTSSAVSMRPFVLRPRKEKNYD